MIDLSNVSGPHNVRVLLAAIHQEGLLNRFYTTLAWNDHNPFASLLPTAIRRQLARRDFSPIPNKQIKQYPTSELLRIALTRLPLSPFRKLSHGLFANNGYNIHDRRVARCLANTTATALYTYDGIALQSMRVAQQRRLFRFYELCADYAGWCQNVHDEEQQLCPEWIPTWPFTVDHNVKNEELARADRIIIPSSHVRDSLTIAADFQSSLRARIEIVPYGAPEPRITATERRHILENHRHRPLKLIYVGSLTQRKGLKYLFDAVDLCHAEIQLTLVGGKIGDPCLPLQQKLAQYSWFPSLDPTRLHALIADHDVLLLPSLSDSWGLVVGEALAAGLPVIVSANTGAKHLVESGRNGFIIPIRNAAAIAEKITALAENRDLLADMAAYALNACIKHSYQNYQSTMVNLIKRYDPE